MLAFSLLAPAAAAAAVALASKNTCDGSLVSCSAAALKADPCCVPHAGLFVFRQRFEPDNGDTGQWGIDGVDVLECNGSRPKAAKTTNPKLTHEDIASKCARAGFDEDAAERAWAQSEVGEGVEETWERCWNTDGRYVTSICDGDVSRFFRALGELHDSLPTADWLANADIIASAGITYRRDDIKKALSVQGHEPTLLCDNTTLTTVLYPVNAVGNLVRFVPHRKPVEADTCPAEGIIYPPSAVLPSPTPASWDPVFRPTMRPITLSHDESRQVKYEEDEDEEGGEPKKLGFFSSRDKKRAGERYGHDAFAGPDRDEL